MMLVKKRNGKSEGPEGQRFSRKSWRVDFVAERTVTKLLGIIVLSSLGPVYFGFTNAPYWMTVVWALACALWWARPTLQSALTDRNWLQPLHYKCTVVATTVAIFVFIFVLPDSAVYLLTTRYQTAAITFSLPPSTFVVATARESR
jgi:hypothetical protein